MSYNQETGMYEGYIYCIENLINHKKYIGYTKNDIKYRWQQHLSKTHRKEDHSIIHLAIDKYGVENFDMYVVKTLYSDNEEMLLTLLKLSEKEHIKEYETISPNGYNILTGGETVPINRITPLYQYTMQGEYISYYKSITEAIQLNGFEDNPRNSKISRCLKGDHCAFGFLWSKEYVDNIIDVYELYNANKYKNRKPCKNARRVVQLDLDMNVICIFESVTLASRYTGISMSFIHNACAESHVKTHYAKGYLWFFEDTYNNLYT